MDLILKCNLSFKLVQQLSTLLGIENLGLMSNYNPNLAHFPFFYYYFF